MEYVGVWPRRDWSMQLTRGGTGPGTQTDGGPRGEMSSCHQLGRACWDWLHSSGLAIEPDKTEVIFFTNSHARHQRPSHIWLADSSRALEYRVEASNTVRYLGIFFDHQLNWKDNRIMTIRARSTVKALQILGNSIRGLNWTQWRTVFNAVILPILTYAAPVWYTGQAGLTRSLLTAQNEAIRHMAGAFRTTPVDPLLQLMGGVFACSAASLCAASWPAFSPPTVFFIVARGTRHPAYSPCLYFGLHLM